MRKLRASSTLIKSLGQHKTVYRYLMLSGKNRKFASFQVGQKHQNRINLDVFFLLFS